MLPYVGGSGLVQPGSINAPNDDNPVAIACLLVMILFLLISFTDCHGLHLMFETGDDHHSKMYDQE